MKSIGIRVSPKCIFYSIVEVENGGFKFNSEKLFVPQSTDFPFTLSFIRTNLFSIIQEYNIK